MLAVAGSLPEGAGWAYELKWDGVRALAFCGPAGCSLVGRSGRDLSAAYPSLLAEPGAAPAAVLDGEVVAFDGSGRPSFQALQHAGGSARAMGRPPLAYLVFDLLVRGDRSMLGCGYDERRAELGQLGLEVPCWSIPDAFGPPGAEVLAASEAAGLEGVVAKRRDSPYVPGRRSSAWVKGKNFRTQEVVIGGYTRGEGRRARQFGALLLGIPGPGGLVYVGNVGTGFDDASLRALGERLGALAADRSPFTDRVPLARSKGVRFVEPVLVGEVRFSEWTAGGRLRQPSWRGLREDKAPGEVVREP